MSTQMLGKVSSHAHFTKVAADYDTQAFAGAGLRWVSKRELDAVRRGLCSVAAGARVLDAGAGNGRVTSVLDADLGFNVTALDAVPEMLATIRRRCPRVETVLARLGEPLPFDTASFDAVVSLRVLKWVPDWDEALTELARVLRPGGSVVVEITNRNSLARLGYSHAAVTSVTRRAVRDVGERAGISWTAEIPGTHLPFALWRAAQSAPRLAAVRSLERGANRALGVTGARSIILTGSKRAEPEPGDAESQPPVHPVSTRPVSTRPVSTSAHRWRRAGSHMFTQAMNDNIDEIARAARSHPRPANVLDLGCWDGRNMLRYAPPGVARFGVELCGAAAATARSRGVTTLSADLNAPFPFRDASFDVVSSNQVIEHLHDTDRFIAEIYRVLRPRGVLVCSTENLASWHNIASLLCGWQAFSLTNVSSTGSGLGNPMANLRGMEPRAPGWEHQRIFSYRGLRELVAAHGFSDVHVVGAGYYPFASALGRVDPRHAAFITVHATKP